MGLWLAAREGLRKDKLRAAGVKLGERALAAARRLPDNTYALAVLRECGQLELDRGDTKAGEEKMTLMLELMLPAQTAPTGK